MPDRPNIVVNTGPLLALVAAVGDLEVLRDLYAQVVVPLEVKEEILAPGARDLGQRELVAASWLELAQEPFPSRRSC